MKARLALPIIVALLILCLTGCYRPAPPPVATLTPVGSVPPGASPPAASPVAVLTDGSAQVAAVTEAIAAGFQRWQPAYGLNVEVSAAGTSAGFERLCRGEIDLVNALRPIDAREAAACAKNGVNWLEVVMGYDVLAVIANPADTFLTCLSLDELRAIWGEAGAVNWSEVRRGFPDLALLPIATELNAAQRRLLEEAIGGALRADAVPGGDDTALMVAQTSGAVGYLGYGRFPPADDAKRAVTFVSIDAGAGCASPTPERVWRGLYGALSRPLYLYVNAASLGRLAVSQFLSYYLSADGQALIAGAGYMPAAPESYEAALKAMAGD